MFVSHTKHARIHANTLLITAQPIRNLRPASATKEGYYNRRFLPSLPNPPPSSPSCLSPTPFGTCYAGYHSVENFFLLGVLRRSLNLKSMSLLTLRGLEKI